MRLLCPHGAVTSVKIPTQKNRTQSRAFGFANFETHADAAQALEAMLAGQIVVPDENGRRWVVHAEWANKNEGFETSRRDKQMMANQELKKSPTSKGSKDSGSTRSGSNDSGSNASLDM